MNTSSTVAFSARVIPTRRVNDIANVMRRHSDFLTGFYTRVLTRYRRLFALGVHRKRDRRLVARGGRSVFIIIVFTREYIDMVSAIPCVHENDENFSVNGKLYHETTDDQTDRGPLDPGPE